MTIDFLSAQNRNTAKKFSRPSRGAIQFSRSRPTGSDVQRSRNNPSCQVNIYCGEYQRCGQCAGNPKQFERLSADEIRYIMDNTDNPELMGAALKKFIKKAKAKVQKTIKKLPKPLRGIAKVSMAVLAPTTAITALTTKATVKTAKLATSKKERVKTANKIKAAQKKVVANIKKLPKPLRIVAGAALAPLMPTTFITAATTAATVKAGKLATSKKERVKTANQIKAVKNKVISNIKKLPKPLRIVAGLALAPLMPATTATLLAAAPIAATGFAAKKATQKIAQVQQARRAAVAAASVVPDEPGEVETAVVPSAIKEQVERGETVTAAMPTDEDGAAATGTTETKKDGMSAILPIAALAALIPFIMG